MSDQQEDEREEKESVGNLARLAEVKPPEDFLKGVQRKIRRRSKGKFFRSRWSTSPAATRVQIVSLVMLLLLVLIWILGGPSSQPTPDRPSDARPPVKNEVRGGWSQ